MEKILVLSFLAVILFVACEGPAGPPGPAGPAGEDGAWQIIETINLTADTNIVTFDGISDEWEMLEVWGTGSLTGTDSTYPGENMNMRFNNDADSNYYPTWADRVCLQSWSTGTSNIIVVINRDTGMPGYFSCNIESMWSNSLGMCYGSNSYSYYVSPDTNYIWRIDVFCDPDTSQIIRSGSEFILLGMDID